MPTATADRNGARAAPSRRGASGRTRTIAARSIADRAGSHVAAGSTIAFRVAFGIVVAASSIRFLWRGWVDEFYLVPAHHLTYPRFDWVRPWPAPWMHLHVCGLALLGVLIAFGIRLRIAAGLFVVGFAYVELIDRALYLNHYWFVTLAAVLLVVLPQPARREAGAARTVPAITVWALRFQLGVVYTFAGLAKLNPDWILRGEPLHTWLSARTDRPLLGPLLDEPLAALAASWIGIAFDLTIVVWLLWQRSRIIAYAVLVMFHLATAALFQIGMFPWVMIALTPIFLAPDWPSVVAGASRRRSSALSPDATPVAARATGVSTRLIAFLVAFAAMNVLLPMRHWVAEGNVRWNDDGYELSWRVMLTDRSGFLEFDVVDPASGRQWRVGADLVLAEWQIAEAETRPPLALHTAHLVAAHFATLGHPRVGVYADSFVAMNGRLRQRMIDPSVDLTTVARWAPAAEYVLPLDPPVRD